MQRPIFYAIVSAFAFSTAPAVAQTTIQSSSASLKRGDPDRILCEREETTGTRLGARRVCLTVHQWNEKRSEHRKTVEKVQQMNTSVGPPVF